MRPPVPREPVAFWADVEALRSDGGLFCDVSIVCGGDAVACHGLVLAALSPMVARAMLSSSGPDAGHVLLLPDADPRAVREAVAAVYGCLAGKVTPEELLNGSGDLLDLLCPDFGAPGRKTEDLVAVPDVAHLKQDPDLAGGDYRDPYDGEWLEDQDFYDEGPDDHYREEVKEVEPFADMEDNEDEDWKPLAGWKAENGRARRGRKRLSGQERTAKQPKRKVGRKRRVPDGEPLPRSSKTPRTSSVPAVDVDAKKLACQMKAQAGTVSAAVEESPPAHLFAKKRAEERFAAVLAVGSGAPGGEDGAAVSATPLAWTPGDDDPMCESEAAAQYEQFLAAATAVFGLSQYESLFRLAWPLVDRSSKNSLHTFHRRKHRKNLAGASHEEVRAVLLEEDVARLAETKEGRKVGSLGLFDQRDAVEIRLSGAVTTDEAVAIVLVWWGADGGVSASVVRFDASKRSKEAENLGHLLRQVWTLRRGPGAPVEQVPSLGERLDDVLNVAGRYEAALDLLEEGMEDRGQWRAKTNEAQSTCPTCGVTFDTGTARQKSAYWAHMYQHSLVDHVCDCEVTWTTQLGKKNHVLLVHREGYRRCEECPYVGRAAGLQAHVEREHRELACELCGSLHRGSRGLDMHTADFHPEAAAARKREGEGKAYRRERKILIKGKCDQCDRSFSTPLKLHTHINDCHKACKCPDCGLEVTGYSQLKRHRRRAHPVGPERVPCEVCGKLIRNESRWLKQHALVHAPADSDAGLQCPACPRRFISNSRLKDHHQAVHLKLRRYQCRYEGCGMAYADTASRCNHERIKHGQTYTKAARQGLVPIIPGINVSEVPIL